MTGAEAESFLRERLPQGRVCVRLYKRADGTIITENCPRGLRAARDAAKRIMHQVATIVSLLLTGLTGSPSF
jgi:molybdate-binding protein